MDYVLILICKHNEKIAAIRIDRSWNFAQLVNKICERWSNLDSESVILSYSLVDNENLLLDNDEDLVTMFGLAESAGYEDIEIVVKDSTVEFFNNTVGDNHNENSGSERANMEYTGIQTTDVDGEARIDDDIPVFCVHKRNSLLSTQWSVGITGVGQKFEGGVSQLRTVLKKYAVQRGFEYILTKNDKMWLTAHCKYRKEKGCAWELHARVFTPNDYFYIRRFVGTHDCGVAVRTPKNTHVTSKFIGDLFTEEVRVTPLKRPVDVVKEMKNDYGLNVSYHQAWWGVEKARNDVFGDYLESFSNLKWYVSAAMTTNPGSHIELDFDEETKRFRRLFVAFAACIQGFNHCRPLIFLDGTFLKGRHKGALLGATGKNGNQGIFPLCFAVVDSENQDNWLWFLQNLEKIIAPGRDITFISDRNIGLLDAVKTVFPNVSHGFCLFHLKSNLRYHLRGSHKTFKEKMVNLLVKCAYAPTRDLFHRYMEKIINDGGGRVSNFFDQLPKENWSNAYFRGVRYGEMYSNVAESFNSWIQKERFLPITNLVDALRVKIMAQISSRREIASRWGGIICPDMDKRLTDAFNDGRSWVVVEAGNNVYEVQSFPNVTVDIARGNCSCQSWQLERFPCVHAVAAICSAGKDLSSYVDPYYHVEAFRASYSFSIYPIPTVWMREQQDDEEFILPPVSKKPPGRPKTQRIPSKGENQNQIKCGRCQRLGNHNRKSCKEAV